MTPEPAPSSRQGLALCLSGGGFRAALFHLGALRRLNELGVLGTVDAVSAVSGGSILAAHLAESVRWPGPGDLVADWDETVARPFRRFVSRDLRTGPVLRRYLLPWNWPRPATSVEALAAAYGRRLTSQRLADLPERPRYVFNATDLVWGVNWEFSRTSIGDWQLGYTSPSVWNPPVALAVAASSCFPPVFGPLRLRLDPGRLTDGAASGPDRERYGDRVLLTDGGLYDNLGLEPVWKEHRTVLVSDGGSPFRPDPRRTPWRRLSRYFTIASGQGIALRKRWLVSSFRSGGLEGTYWGLGSATARYGSDAGYSAALVESHLARVRTDLDPFTPDEIAVLENHGYLLADAAVARHQAHLITREAPVDPPFPDLMAADRVRQALGRSHRRSVLGFR